jgi:tripartite-type tricarboxylate transporter receptor subunit TctC
MKRIAAVAAALAVLSASASAQDYPNKPVRVIASSSAGGISDIFMRVLGEEMHKRWGQPLVIENRPGGQFNIGAKACVDAAPDGYTICILPADVLQYNRHVIRNLNYDMFTDLEPVTLLFFLTQGLAVSSKLSVSTLDQLAAYSKAHPGTLSYTAAAIPHQAFMESWKERSGADIVRVPFKGGGDAVNGMLTGVTPVAFFGIGNFAAHLRAGTLKGIAVDADKRSPLFPDIPTLKEIDPAAEVTRADFSIWVPKGTPKAIISRIRDEIAKVASDPAFVDKNVVQRGLDPSFNTPEQFAQYLKEQRAQVDQTAKKANLQPQ